MDWIRGTGIAWCLAWGGVFVAALLLRAGPDFDPGRRRLLTAASGTVLALPLAATGAAVMIGRDQLHLVEEEIAYPGLPADLDGLRIVHLSDIHLGPFLDAATVRRAVDMANETRPHLAVVTGDLITLRDDHLSECLQLLAGLRADAGVYGCHGNHEKRARCLERATAEGAALGIEFLRQESRQLRFGQATVNVAGVDYQLMKRPYLVGADRLLREGGFNLMLSHNPDVFPTAAAQGWDLTLAGHTHGGQVTVEFLHQYVNVARVFTPFLYGTYRRDRSAIYVTRGIGTVGVPARIGAPPEIGLIRLCAI
jgi:predicted MPP superfamily phosphohydrolase